MAQINRAFMLFLSTFIIFHLGAFCYKLSLQGGELDWIHKNMFYLTYTLITSIFCYVAGIMLLVVFEGVSIRWRLGLGLYGLVMITCLFLYDQENTIEHHGGYNSLVFLMLFFPLLLLSISTLTCYKRMPRRKFLIMWLAIITTLTIATSIRLARGSFLWEKGLGGARLEAATSANGLGCDIIPARFIWEDVLPNRAINFWTGSQSCPTIPQFAEFSNGGVDGRILTVDCPGAAGADVMLLPSPLGVPAENKSEEGPLQQFTLAAAKRISLKPGKHELRVDDSEAALVTCPGGPGNPPGNGYDNLVFQCLRSPEAVARVTTAAGPAGTNVRPSTAVGRKPNVLIVYMDALARRHFLRKFPETVNLLEEMISTGKAPPPKPPKGSAAKTVSTASTTTPSPDVEVFQFFRYHALSMHTNNNLKGIFIGETPGHDKGHARGAERLRPIWQDFYENGWITTVIDNSCQDWAAKYFTLPSAGLDHHFVTPFCLPEYYPPGNPHGNWVGPFAIRRRCMAGRHVHKYVWDYLGKFWKAYEDVPKFAFAAWTEGHEGTGEVIGMLDPQIAEFFRSGTVDFRDTLVFFMSDHGLHMGLWWGLQTRNSRLENALPNFLAVLPKDFVDSRPGMRENLLNNEQALLNAFDLHTTLHKLTGATSRNPADSFAYSLLADSIPRGRTCDDAGIDVDRCQCGLKKNRN